MKEANKKIGLEYNGEPVMTTAQVAFMLETTVDEVVSVFNKHRSRFEEGKDFFALRGKARHDFVERFPTPELQVSSDPLILWTERGILAVAFPIDTPAAWKLHKEFIHRCKKMGLI